MYRHRPSGYKARSQQDSSDRGLLALVNSDRLRQILSKMLDENEFLSLYGIRSPSKYHEKHPYTFQVEGQEYRVDYPIAESNTGMFGGNSNWRGPVWMAVNEAREGRQVNKSALSRYFERRK